MPWRFCHTNGQQHLPSQPFACPCTSLVLSPGRWKGGNPEETDLVSFRNLLGAVPEGVKRVVFTSSAGVERQNSFPYIILNLFGAPPCWALADC